MSERKASSAQPVLFFFVGLSFLALLVFALILAAEGALDLLLHPLTWLGRLQPGAALDMLSNAAEVVAGVLAIAITVVAIVVELAANRYTHRITQLFVREPVNIAVMTLFVITTIQCLWVGATFGGELATGHSWTYAGLVISMGLVTLCLLVLLPYFAFVFSFLSPPNVVTRLRDSALRAIERADGPSLGRWRAEVMEAVDELEDVARGAMTHGDRGIGMAAIDALGGLVRRYASGKSALPAAWFIPSEDVISKDPDFVSLASSSLEVILEQHSWLEYKVLRQLHGLFIRALGEARELCDRIALEVFRIGETALRGSDQGAVVQVIRAFNSLLRAAVNADDLRSAYFILDQYRSFAAVAQEVGQHETALAAADHLVEYGQLGQEKGQSFLVEVVAYDLVRLVQQATEQAQENVDALLARLLEVDEVAAQDGGSKLRGVRRAQVQLGVFFLARGDAEHAQVIQRDMANESPDLLAGIHRELALETRDQYWEFTDRGENFGYLRPEERALLDTFLASVGE
ncbi:MAG: DUF2254 domain-containing protein [Deltaproteobacteria bacterium]|nr:DUF2254 domain-containing protein [Deltaproteobacteria bacterium]